MKTYIAVAVLSALLMSCESPAYAAGLDEATQIGQWALGRPYSNDDRGCTGADATAANQTPATPDGRLQGATISGKPSQTGECSNYDCSSLVGWILRGAGLTSWVGDYKSGEPPSTFVMWGGWTDEGRPADGKPFTASPSDHPACDPTKEPICVGFTHWDKDGGIGPGHVIIAVNGIVYESAGAQSENQNGTAGGHVTMYGAGGVSGSVWNENDPYNQVLWVEP